jgi:1,4-dihydroxy-2-naphthoate octaprenyltransferase
MLFFGPVAVWGTAFLQGGLERPWHIVLVGLVPGLMAAAIMGINNLRDLETDAKVGKITLAVIFGERNARLIPVMAIAMAYLFIIMFALAWSWFLLLGLLTVPLAYNLCFKLLIAPIDEQLNVALAMAGKLSMMTSLLLSLAFLLYVQHPGF